MRLVVCLLLFIAVLVQAQTPANKPEIRTDSASANGAARLPVKRVVLFKNGVGYFEHVGQVTGTQNVSIDFTTAQLNDVLKSLTAIDLGEGRISGVSYNSVEPLERQLGSLRLGLGDDVTGGQFLAALKGARVEVRSGGQVVTGRVLSVEERKVKAGKEDTVSVDYLSVITETGELRQFEMTPALGVRLLEAEMRDDVNRYMSVLASGREQDLRRMVIRDTGTGTRPLQVSYISEVPVWKSTYRLVLPSDSTKPFIQGWAIVDNTVGEDWKEVELSLVAGAPQSFVQELSKPYYARRPEVELPRAAMLTPQTHDRAVDKQFDRLQQWAALKQPASIPMKVAPPPPATPGEELIEGRQVRQLPLNGRSYTSLTQLQPGASGANNYDAATATDLGDMFEYRLKDRITIRKNQSALVPIIQANVEAEKVTLYDSENERPLRAVWLKNTSDLTLDGGTFNVLDENVFAGEGILEVIKPGERRLLSYALDQGIVVNSDEEENEKQVTHVLIRNGTMWLTREKRSKQTYTIQNENTDAREVIVEHPTESGWKLVSPTQPIETTAEQFRFKVHVEPEDSAELVVEQSYPVESSFGLSTLNPEMIAVLVRDRSITPEVEQALRTVVEKQGALYQVRAQIKSREEEVSAIAKDQERLRENMKALKGSAEERALLQRYTRQLDQQEDTLGRLKGELDDLRGKEDAAKADLDRTVQKVSFDVLL